MAGLVILLLAAAGIVIWGLFNLVNGYKAIRDSLEGETAEQGRKQIRLGIIIFIAISAFLLIGFSTCLVMIGGY
jgi:hypothetical protein